MWGVNPLTWTMKTALYPGHHPSRFGNSIEKFPPQWVHMGTPCSYSYISPTYACLYTNTTQSSSVCILVFILQLASMHFNAFHIIYCGTWKDRHLCPTCKQCFYRSKFEAERVQRAGPSAWAGLPRSLPLYKLLGVAYIHRMDLHGLPLSCRSTAFVKAMCTCQFTHCILLLSQLPCLGHKQHLGLCARTIAELLQTKKTCGFTGVHKI